jgi:hypothetical protein
MRYEKPECVTMPGTLTNVTPEMLAPTMPNATMYHGDFRSPRKKTLLLLLEVARRLTPRSKRK